MLLSVCIMVLKQKNFFEQTLPYLVFSFSSVFCADVVILIQILLSKFSLKIIIADVTLECYSVLFCVRLETMRMTKLLFHLHNGQSARPSCLKQT